MFQIGQWVKCGPKKAKVHAIRYVVEYSDGRRLNLQEQELEACEQPSEKETWLEVTMRIRYTLDHNSEKTTRDTLLAFLEHRGIEATDEVVSRLDRLIEAAKRFF